VLATWIVTAGSSITDLFSLQHEDDSQCLDGILFRCGNFGMFLVCARNKLIDVSGMHLMSSFKHSCSLLCFLSQNDCRLARSIINRNP